MKFCLKKKSSPNSEEKILCASREVRSWDQKCKRCAFLTVKIRVVSQNFDQNNLWSFQIILKPSLREAPLRSWESQNLDVTSVRPSVRPDF